jgi:phosphonate transport system substrate-binding protein
MRNRIELTTWLARLSLISLVFLLGACAHPTPTPTATPAPTPSPTTPITPFPTRTPTLPPPASDENPLILGIVSETNDPKAATAASDLAQQVAGITNFKIQSRVYKTSAALLADLQLSKVHIVFLQPFTYILAQQKGLVQPVLLINHFGVYQFGAQFLANVSSKFTIYFDPAKNQNTTEPFTALKQLDGKRPCWVDPTSSSGYVVPLGFLIDKGYKVKDGVFTLSNTAVVRALYVNGICDFGTTFATTGDPRTSPAVTQDLTDVMNRIVVLYQIDPVIPNLNISMLASLPKDMRDDLAFAMQSIVHTDKGKASFTTANDYETTDLKTIDDSVYDPIRNYLKLSGVNIETLIGK